MRTSPAKHPLAFMTELPITSEDLQTARPPDALKKWCEKKFEEISTCEGGVSALRMKKGLCKPLVEEVYPIAMWAFHSQAVSPSALITPCIGSQPYDAVVKDSLSEPTEYRVEVTQAHMGQSEHFRMQHLEQEGWSPGGLSRVRRTGSRRSYRYEAGRITESTKSHVQNAYTLVREAVSRKLGKPYQPPIVLLVAFEDHIVKNHVSIESEMREAVMEALSENVVQFSSIFLVGMSGKLNFEVKVES